jgi:type I restriction enzyme S subunit
MEQGKSPECENSPASSKQWGVLKTSCVNNAIFNIDDNKALPAHIIPHSQYEVFSGDILMSRASGSISLIGSVARVQSNVRNKILLSDKVFRLILTDKVDPDYFIYLMSSSYVRKLVESAISGAEGMANNITKSAIMEFFVPVPELQEQKRIVKVLSKKLNIFDLLIAKSQQASDLGKERKTALISAAVTGKIDVRDWNAG